MPDVRMPDGTVIKNVPEGTTRAQLMARVQKAQPRARQTGVGAVDQTLSSVNEFLIGVPQGLYNAASFVTDPIAQLLVGKKAVKQARQQRQNVVDKAERALVSRPSPVARTVGQIAGTVNPAVTAIRAPSVLGRAAPAALRAIQGAIGGAAVRDSDETGNQEAAIGAAANVILPPLIGKLAATRPARAIGRAVRDVAAPVVNPIVNAADDISEAVLGKARPALGLDYKPSPGNVPLIPPHPPAPAPVTADLGRAANVREARFRALGAKPTTGMVTRDPRVWNFERETAKMSGVGDDLVGQFKAVENDLANVGSNLVRNQGGARGPEATGLTVQKALDAKRDEMQQVTSALYKRVRDTRGDAPAGPLNTLRDALDSPDMTDNPVFDTMRDGIMRRLRRFGMAGESGLLRNDAVASVSQAEELRKMIGNLGPSNEPSVKMMRKALIDAIDDDVVLAVGDDAFKAARASARERFSEFSKTFAGKIADEGIPPEKLTQRIFGSTSLKDIRSLKMSMLTGTKEQVARGRDAMRSLRAQAVEDVMGGAVSPDGKLNGTALYKRFEKDSAKLREILDPADYKTLRRLALAARDATAEVPFSAVNNSNTTSAAANLFKRLPGKDKGGILKMLAKHAAAFSAGGPAANVGVMVADEALKQRAGSKAAQTLAEQVRMAQNPAAAAQRVGESQQAARTGEKLADLIQWWQDLTGNSPALGGAVASQTKK